MKCRKNVRNIAAKDRFVNAVRALMTQDSVLHPGAQSRYDDFVETHLLAMHDMDTDTMRPESWGHSGSIFLPWHRELLYQFEKLLQGVDPEVMIPYWDWTRAKSSANPGYPFTHDFLSVDGTDAEPWFGGGIDPVKIHQTLQRRLQRRGVVIADRTARR